MPVKKPHVVGVNTPVHTPVVIATPKPFYTSKTLWVNLLGFVIIVLQGTGSINLIDPKLLALALVIVNAVLRFVTDKPISV